jgi:hypothetical protein
MDEPVVPGSDARVALDQIEALRRRVRADRHPLSLPLLVMGLIATTGSTLQLLSALAIERMAPGYSVYGIDASFSYWALAVPAGFGLLALIESWRWRRRGLDGGGRRFAAVTVLALALAVLPFAWLLTIILGPLAVVGAGLLLAGLWLRQRPLAVAGVVFGVLGAVEGLFWISNRVPPTMWRGWIHDAILLGIAAAMVLTGAVAWLRETRTAR